MTQTGAEKRAGKTACADSGGAAKPSVRTPLTRYEAPTQARIETRIGCVKHRTAWSRAQMPIRAHEQVASTFVCRTGVLLIGEKIDGTGTIRVKPALDCGGRTHRRVSPWRAG